MQSRTSQKSILSLAVKRKSQTPTQEPPEKLQIVHQQPTALKCFAVLPGKRVNREKDFGDDEINFTGIGDYKSSDESDGSSELDEFVSGKMDLTGRMIRKKKECDE